MLAGARDANGVLYTLAAAVPAGSVMVGGVALSPLGSVYTTPTLSANDSYPNGFRVSPTGQLVTTNAAVAVNNKDGIARAADGQAVVTTLGVTSASPYLGRLRLTSGGAIHIRTDTPGTIRSFSSGFSTGFG